MENFKPTHDMIEAARTLFSAMAFEKTVRPIVEGIQLTVLQQNSFRFMDEEAKETNPDGSKTFPEFVKTIQHAWLMNEEDFKVFHKLCHELTTVAGLVVEDPEQCPLLVAENITILAENLLIDVMEPINHISFDDLCCSGDFLGNRRQLIDLTLRLLAPFVKL